MGRMPSLRETRVIGSRYTRTLGFLEGFDGMGIFTVMVRGRAEARSTTQRVST